MNISALFDSFTFAPHIEVVIPLPPERTTFRQSSFTRDVLLQHLNDRREPPARGFADQQVNVFGHYDVSTNMRSPAENYREAWALLMRSRDDTATQASEAVHSTEAARKTVTDSVST